MRDKQVVDRIMLRELVYWTHRILSKTQYYRERGDALDVAFMVTMSLLLNLIALIYIFEYYTSWDILKYIPIKGRGDLMSWLTAVLLFAPVVILIYRRYTKRDKMKAMLKKYKGMSERRLFWGRLLFVLYVLTSIIGFWVVPHFFKH